MEDIDKLIGDALFLCKKYDKAAPPLFQRLLGLDYNTAEKVFFALVDMGVVVNVQKQEDDEEVPIGDIDKNALLGYLKN